MPLFEDDTNISAVPPSTVYRWQTAFWHLLLVVSNFILIYDFTYVIYNYIDINKFEDDKYECIALLQPCISGRPPFGELPPIQRAPPVAFPRPRSDTKRHNINMLTSEGHFRCTMHYRIAAEKYFRPTI